MLSTRRHTDERQTHLVRAGQWLVAVEGGPWLSSECIGTWRVCPNKAHNLAQYLVSVSHSCVSYPNVGANQNQPPSRSALDSLPSSSRPFPVFCLGCLVCVHSFYASHACIGCRETAVPRQFADISSPDRPCLTES
jgi:hypothetical protein